jgi:RNA polymerase sigma-70 factor (ECF subfamily)
MGHILKYVDRLSLFMTKNTVSDAELMARLARGDMSALGELARKHQSRVLELAYRTLGSWDLAEDVAQETFLRVYRSAKRYEPTAKFTTWLYRIVVNLCLDEQRKRAKAGASLEPDVYEQIPASNDDSAEKEELAEKVKAAVQSLPERQRTALILHRYHGLNHAEVGEVTGWTQSAVESLLVRAYANLRGKLAKMKNLIE